MAPQPVQAAWTEAGLGSATCIQLYCPGSLEAGATLMVTTVVGGRREAMHPLGVIQFTGIGGTKDDRNLRVGVVLCPHAT
ncbi:hypothetical protein TRIUR3_27746 [Triticum urartu]|uniref:Uncharacterized protein n=1 Tax=Triticum urartu TaxID=4572 RepID=M7ZU73_TRIUA|nr:hypothetical protein TRIUR3_27746 [Triticum urartu]